jgi:acetyl esterase/lipase
LASVVGGRAADVPRFYDLFSPINHVGSHCPPTLLFLAKDDDVIPNQPVRIMKQNLIAAGTPVVLIEYPDTVHGFDLILPRYSPAARSALYDLERFLALMI